MQTTTTTPKKIGRPRVLTDAERIERRKARERKRYERIKQTPEWLKRKREAGRRSAAKRRAEDPEKNLEAHRLFYNRHRTRYLEKQREYRQRNREEINARARARRAANPEKAREDRERYNQRRRAMNKAEKLAKQAKQLQEETQRRVDEFNKLLRIGYNATT